MSEGWFGYVEQSTFDLRAVAREVGSAECHVCEASAAHLVDLSQDVENAVELGSAVFLCQLCFSLVSSHGTEALTKVHGNFRFGGRSNRRANDLGERSECACQPIGFVIAAE